MMNTTLTAAERVLVLTTSPHVTEVMRTACTDLRAEHAELLAALRFAADKLDDAIRLGGCSAASYARARNEARAVIAKIEGAA